jgi:hypothetical protein
MADSTINAMADEIIAHIFSFLPCVDLVARVRRVCCRWLAVASDSLAIGTNCARLRYSDCLHQHKPPLCVRAATFGHVRCLVDARNREHTWGPDACVAAAANGRLAALVWLHHQGCPRNDDTCRAAAARGHVECLAFAHENGRSLSRCDWKKAVHRGDIHVVQCALKHGWVPKKRMLHIAVARDDVAMVRCLTASGCPWDAERILHIAIDSGSLSCLDYICCKRGHPRDAAIGLRAIRAGRLKILDYVDNQSRLHDAHARQDGTRDCGSATDTATRRHVASKYDPLTIGGDNRDIKQPNGPPKKGRTKGAQGLRKKPPTFDVPLFYRSQ